MSPPFPLYQPPPSFDLSTLILTHLFSFLFFHQVHVLRFLCGLYTSLLLGHLFRTRDCQCFVRGSRRLVQIRSWSRRGGFKSRGLFFFNYDLPCPWVVMMIKCAKITTVFLDRGGTWVARSPEGVDRRWLMTDLGMDWTPAPRDREVDRG